MIQHSLSHALREIFSDKKTGLWPKIVGIYVLLIIANFLAWAWAFAVFHDNAVLLGTAFVAYTFGLRHGVDADHIAAIDNVTRKMIQEGKRPVSIGLMFSLGHSTVVFLMSVTVAITGGILQTHFTAFKSFGNVIGTLVSSLFLFIIALINLVSLINIVRAFRDEEVNVLVSKGGLLTRLFHPMFRVVSKSWHMYPVGFLFGLGFDTATEIGLLGISAASVAHGIPIWSILVFPFLFTVGMTLIDTTDGIMMLGAYGWAFIKPIRTIFYNVTITSLSILIALVIGGIEIFGLIGDELGLQSPFWKVIGSLNNNFGAIGYIIIALFVASWGISWDDRVKQ